MESIVWWIKLVMSVIYKWMFPYPEIQWFHLEIILWKFHRIDLGMFSIVVATGQEMVREKIISSRSGNFSLNQGKVKFLKEVKEKWNFKSTYLFFSLYFYCFLIFKIPLYILQTWIVLYWYKTVHEAEWQADVGFSRTSICFTHYVNKLSIHVHCTWLAESINKWVKGRDGSSGLMYEIIYCYCSWSVKSQLWNNFGVALIQLPVYWERCKVPDRLPSGED